MGIEKFFSTINRTFNIITTIDLNILEDSSNIDTDYLYIDFNSIIHQTSSKLLEKLNSPSDHYNRLNIQHELLLRINFHNLFIILFNLIYLFLYLLYFSKKNLFNRTLTP